MSPTRRMILGGLASAPFAAVLPGAASTTSSDIDGLWRAFLLARGADTVALRAVEAAEAQLPWWAVSGPSHVNHRGILCGDISHWPARQEYRLPSNGAWVRIRQSRLDAISGFEHDRRVLGEEPARRAFAEFEDRLAARDRERRLVCLDVLTQRLEQLGDRMYDHQQSILTLQPSSLAILAAQIMTATVTNEFTYATAENSDQMSLAAVALRGLLPHLSGDIAQDAAEFVDNPDRRLDQMRASVGILPIGMGSAA